MVLLLSMLSLTSCLVPKRSEIDANIWLNNGPLPAELCAANPDLALFGFYRRLNDDRLEFVSFCNPASREWLAINDKDFNKLLDKYVPKKEK